MFDFLPWQPVLGARKRASSHDRSGGNRDYWMIERGEMKTLLVHEGSSGVVLRIWFTLSTKDPAYLRTTSFSLRFDGEDTAPDIPVGMLTGTGPWAVNDLRSATANVMRARRTNKDQEGTGFGSFNLAWPMPFAHECSVRVRNGSAMPLMMHFHVDYLADVPTGDPPLLFHATHHLAERTAPVGFSTDVVPGTDLTDGSRNLSNACNHVFAAIEGHSGNYAGTVLSVESHPDRSGKWYEGDDMFFVDGELWPPSVHGTGTEDYFGMAWGVHRPYQAWDHGVTHYERHLTAHDRFYDGRFTLYRWHLADPIPFRKRLHASIEAGHANDCAQFYESLALWYGKRITGPF